MNCFDLGITKVGFFLLPFHVLQPKADFPDPKRIELLRARKVLLGNIEKPEGNLNK